MCQLQWHTCTFRHALRAAYRTAISAAQILVIIIIIRPIIIIWPVLHGYLQCLPMPLLRHQRRTKRVDELHWNWMIAFYCRRILVSIALGKISFLARSDIGAGNNLSVPLLTAVRCHYPVFLLTSLPFLKQIDWLIDW